MTDLDRLLAAIIATPDDDAARLVCADKFEERDGPGDAERAEFIRYSIDRDFHGEEGLPDHETEYAREADVWPFRDWPDSVHSLAGIKCNDINCLDHGGLSFVWRRGFIAEVRAPLAALVGGECGRCHGRGFLGHPAPGQHGYIGAPNCPVCHGTGRTLAALPAIAKSHPLERVEVVDRRPWQNGYSRKFVWWRESAWSTPDFLFDIIASAHPENVLHHGGPPSFEHIAFDSEHDALAALSRALIAWARKKQT